MVKDGAGRCAASTAAISAAVTRGMSPGTVSIPPRPSRARIRAAAVTAPVWPSRAPSVEHARAVSCGEPDRDGIDGAHHDSRQRRHAREHREHILRHRCGQRAALIRRQQRGETLLGAVYLLHRHDGPDIRRTHARSRRIASAASSTARASASLSARLVISCVLGTRAHRRPRPRPLRRTT